jgi:hypothetical protein
MDGGVGGVFKLLEEDIAVGVRPDDFLGLADGSAHAFGAFGEFEFGAEDGEDFAPFERHGFRHGEGDGVTPGGGDEGEGDSGVTAGGFDEFFAGFEDAALFGVPDHGSADAAFDGVGRVTAFDFGEHVDGQSVRDAVEADERGASDA